VESLPRESAGEASPKRSSFPPQSSSIESVLQLSPFVSSSLPPDKVEQQTELFLVMFATAVETENPLEEEWAYAKMKAAFVELMDDPPIDPMHSLPMGLWEAMQWAAKLRVTRERAREAAGRASP
jgi:hypothetical protein